MQVLLDGLSIIVKYQEAMLIFFITVLGLGYFSIKNALLPKLGNGLTLLAGFCLGSAVLSVLSYILVLLSHFLPVLLYLGSYAIFFFSTIVLIRGFWLGELKLLVTANMVLGLIMVSLLMLIRFAFLKYIILPPYSDSPIHYQIVSGFLHPSAPDNGLQLSFDTILSEYYHFGFHSLATWLALVADVGVASAISLLGQIFLVTAPLCMMFLVYAITENVGGAVFAGLLSAIAWIMPSFSINWGKFPALFAISTFPAIVSLLFLMFLRKVEKMKVFLSLIFMIGITFIHTRIFIVMLLGVVVFLIIDKLKIRGELGFFQSIRFTALFLLSLWPLSQIIIDFYYGPLTLMVLLFLIPFAFQIYSTAAIGVLIFTSGLSLITLIPNYLSVGGQSLLDRQFLAMFLYIPFSLMGGLGISGLIKKLDLQPVHKTAVLAAFMGGIIFSSNSQSFYPDTCCNYFREGDRLAFQWIQNNISPHNLYFISTFTDGDKTYGTDAGVWISPLTSLPSNKLPHKTHWDKADIKDQICPSDLSESYIYMGGTQSSFDNNQLIQVSWIVPVFKSGEVVIYKVSNCSNIDE